MIALNWFSNRVLPTFKILTNVNGHGLGNRSNLVQGDQRQGVEADVIHDPQARVGPTVRLEIDGSEGFFDHLKHSIPQRISISCGLHGEMGDESIPHSVVGIVLEFVHNHDLREELHCSLH